MTTTPKRPEVEDILATEAEYLGTNAVQTRLLSRFTRENGTKPSTLRQSTLLILLRKEKRLHPSYLTSHDPYSPACGTVNYKNKPTAVWKGKTKCPLGLMSVQDKQRKH